MREITGDRPLSRGEQVRYLGIFLSRVWGLFLFGRTRAFIPSRVAEDTNSLFRKYIDSFLREKIPTLLSSRTIDVFDIGCGGGYLRPILAELGYAGSYTGVDVVREPRFTDFETSAFVSNIIVAPIEDVRVEREYDLVVSNTSFEHIANDVRAREKAACAAGKRGVEVHIVPSWWSFFSYLWHGYRHYTPRSLTRLFQGGRYEVYRLGGMFSFLGQFFLFTIPERYCGVKVRSKSWYPKMAARLIHLDRFLPLCPMGYAVVVYER